MDISVIIPFYNAAPYIERCIKGLLAQTYPLDRVEVLMVDNNSTDGSAEIVRRFPQVTLLHEEKQGAYAARNCGLAHARGDLIAFTDPDCVPHVDWLQRLHDAFTDTATHVVMGRSLPGGPSDALRLLDAYEHHREAYVLASKDATLYYGHTNNMAARRGALDSFGPFEERPRGADTIFVRRTVEGWGCPSVQYEPLAQVDHLEVSDLQTYYRKVFIYGRSRQSYSRIIRARPLRTDERIAVYLRAVRAEHLDAVAAAKLLFLLVLGVGCWYAGALSMPRPSQSVAAAPA